MEENAPGSAIVNDHAHRLRCQVRIGGEHYADVPAGVGTIGARKYWPVACRLPRWFVVGEIWGGDGGGSHA